MDVIWTEEVEDKLVDLWQENECCKLSLAVVKEIVTRKGKRLAAVPCPRCLEISGK